MSVILGQAHGAAAPAHNGQQLTSHPESPGSQKHASSPSDTQVSVGEAQNPPHNGASEASQGVRATQEQEVPLFRHSEPIGQTPPHTGKVSPQGQAGSKA